MERLGGRFKALHHAIDAKRAAIADSDTGITPEKVLVFETVGPVEKFFNAMRRTNLEWLAESVAADQPGDDDFFDLKDPTKPLGGRVYFSMVNQTAIYQLLSLWNRWKRGQQLKYGLGPFKTLFEQTRSVRFWNANDRLVPDVVSYWRERLDAGDEAIRFEIELVFSQAQNRRETREGTVRSLVAAAGGQFVRACLIPDIQYHGILVELPAQNIREFLETTDDVALAQADEVMYFRSVGQCEVSVPEEDAEEVAPSDEGGELGEPIAAMLDGLPANHSWISPYLQIDDPDDWANAYPANHRRHGTAMASLILHGDRSLNNEPPNRYLYVRPILKPDSLAFNQPPPEIIPRDELMVDLIHRAVVRLFEAHDGEPAASPNVRVINISVGDPHRLFYSEMSPVARLLDWLSWRYEVLFIISSGNHLQSISIPIARNDFRSATPEEQKEYVLKALYVDRANRRMMAPAESLNSLSVGALHDDSSSPVARADLVDPVGDIIFPLATSPIAQGMNRSIKPDICMPGGRVFYEIRPDGDGNPTELAPVSNLRPPGQQVALPVGTGGQGSGYVAGSSNAAANATRSAVALFDQVVRPLREEHEFSKQHEVCMLKALLCHGASWGPNQDRLWKLLRNEGVDPSQIRDAMSAFLGYGASDIDRVLSSTERRATVIAAGNVENDLGHYYDLPLPSTLSGNTIQRRLVITLAWVTPCDGRLQRYRKASLWADFGVKKNNPLRVERTESNHATVRRGTLQHEILVKSSVVDFDDETTLPISIHCASDAGTLEESIPYAMCVTLEIPEDSTVEIYEEIRTKIASRIAVAASA